MSELKTEDQQNGYNNNSSDIQTTQIKNGLTPDNNIYNFYSQRKIIKRKNWCNENSFLLMVLVLIFLCIFSTVGLVLMWFTNCFNDLLLSNLVLSENSAAVEWWKNPPINSYLKVHIFNYTNADRFLTGLDDKLIVEDLGPYVYIETITKVNTEFVNNTISYNEKRTHKFSPELSTGKMYDKVIVPNVPMMSAMKLAKERNYFYRFGLNTAFTTSGSKPFKVLAADSFLWGYDDELIGIIKTFEPLPFDKFGIITNRNGTSKDRLIIHTGEGDISKIAMVQGYNDQNKMNFWSTDECNRIDGTDGSQFAPHLVNNKQTIEVYIKDMCRKFPLVYEKEVVLFNEIPAWRFKAPDDVFAHPKSNPDNQCYCHIDSGMCAPHGLFNITTCSNGAPIFASFPHFYMGDPKLSKKFIGLNPDPELHKTYADIHPRLAFPISGASRFQINIEIQKAGLVSGFDSFEDGDILPIIWLEVVPGELTDDIKQLIYHSSFSANAVQLVLEYGTLLITTLTLILIVIAIYCRRKQHLRHILPTRNFVDYQTNINNCVK